MTTSINKICLVAIFSLTLFCCSNETKQVEVQQPQDEGYSSVELAYFTLNDLPFVTSYDSLIEFLGMPDKDATNYSKQDTLQTLYYHLDGSEISFTQDHDRVVLSYVEFGQNSNYVLENKYAKFSRNTRLDPFKVLFNDSVEKRSVRGEVSTIYLKVEEYSKTWIRLEFESDQLKWIHFDFPTGARQL